MVAAQEVMAELSLAIRQIGVKMNLYQCQIKPIAPFATKLKGDTIFGQICWAIAYKYGKDELENLLNNYENRPFLIVSDGFAPGFLPKPKAPSYILGEDMLTKKQNRDKIWLDIASLQSAKFSHAKSNDEANYKIVANATIKNSINYLSNTTGDGFSPYALMEFNIPITQIYFLLDINQFSTKKLAQTLEFVSQMGYGKKSSIGKGRFEIIQELSPVLEPFITNSNSFMTLSPCVIEGDYDECYYEPFTRFGKHGAQLAVKNPFKNPILMADTAALITPKTSELNSIKSKGYIGKAVANISSTQPNAYSQGYAIIISVAKEIG